MNILHVIAYIVMVFAYGATAYLAVTAWSRLRVMQKDVERANKVLTKLLMMAAAGNIQDNFDQINRMKTVLAELVNGEQYEEAAKLKASIARAEEGAMKSLRAFKEAFGDDISFEVTKVSEKNPNQ